MRTEFLCISLLRAASGPRLKLANCKSALYSKTGVYRGIHFFLLLLKSIDCGYSLEPLRRVRTASPRRF